MSQGDPGDCLSQSLEFSQCPLREGHISVNISLTHSVFHISLHHIKEGCAMNLTPETNQNVVPRDKALVIGCDI